jgi:hypothetical protein
MTHPDRVDVSEWSHPEPPEGFADGVLAAIERDDAQRRRRRTVMSSLGAAVLGVAAVLALVPRGVVPNAPSSSGELTAEATRQIELGPGALAVVERYGHLVWSAAGVVQDRGDVFYRLAPGVRLDVRTPAGAVSSVGACSRIKVVPSATGPATVLVSVAQGEVELRAAAGGTGGRVVLAAGRYARIGPDRIRTDADDDDGAIAFALAPDRALTYVDAFRAVTVASPPVGSATSTRPPPPRVPSAPPASASAAPSAPPPKRVLRVPRCECQPSDSLCACFD